MEKTNSYIAALPIVFGCLLRIVFEKSRGFFFIRCCGLSGDHQSATVDNKGEK